MEIHLKMKNILTLENVCDSFSASFIFRILVIFTELCSARQQFKEWKEPKTLPGQRLGGTYKTQTELKHPKTPVQGSNEPSLVTSTLVCPSQASVETLASTEGRQHLHIYSN